MRWYIAGATSLKLAGACQIKARTEVSERADYLRRGIRLHGVMDVGEREAGAQRLALTANDIDI